MRNLHYQEIMKQHIYGKNFSRKIDMDYIPGILFEKTIINYDK